MFHVVVNKHVVRSNLAKAPQDREPPFRISRGKHGKPFYASQIHFPAGATLVYDVDDPMPCGATVWLESDAIDTLEAGDHRIGED